MTIELTTIRHALPRKWHHWAVVETTNAADDLDGSWVLSWHTSRRMAAWACARRIEHLADNGCIGLSTAVRPAKSPEVRYLARVRRVIR